MNFRFSLVAPTVAVCLALAACADEQPAPTQPVDTPKVKVIGDELCEVDANGAVVGKCTPLTLTDCSIDPHEGREPTRGQENKEKC